MENKLQKPLHISDNVLLEQFDGEQIKSHKSNTIVLMNFEIIDGELN